MPKTEYYVAIEAVSIITEQNRGMTQSVLQAIFPHIDSRIPSFLSLMGCCSLITEPVFLKSWCITCFPFCDLSCLKYHSYLLLLSFNCFFFFLFISFDFLPSLPKLIWIQLLPFHCSSQISACPCIILYRHLTNIFCISVSKSSVWTLNKVRLGTGPCKASSSMTHRKLSGHIY